MAKLNLGAVTAYADAVKAGFTGTREEFAEWLANAGKNAAAVAANLEESKAVLTNTEKNAAAVAANLEESKAVLTNVNTAGETQVKAVQDEGAVQIKAVEDAAEAKKTEISGLDAVRFDVPQDDKTPAQKKQARTNIDAASQEDVDRLSEAIADIGVPETKKYGIIWNKVTAQCTRIWDASGITTTTTNFGHFGQVNSNYGNPFDYIYPWSDRRVCNVDIAAYYTMDKNGYNILDAVTAWEGESRFSYDPAPGIMVGVYTPEFWYTAYDTADGRVFGVSGNKVVGWLHAEPTIGGRWFGVLENITLGGTSKNILGSRVGMPATNIEMSTLHTYAKNDDMTLDDIYSYDYTSILMAVEYATLNTQTAVGNGCSDLYRQSSDKIQENAENTNTIKVAASAAGSCIVNAIIDIGTTNGGRQIANRIITAVETDSTDSTKKILTISGAPISITTENFWSIHGCGNAEDAEIGSKSGYIGTNGKCNAYYRGQVSHANMFCYVLGAYREKDTNHIWIAESRAAAENHDSLNTSVHMDTGITLPSGADGVAAYNGYIKTIDTVPNKLGLPPFCSSGDGNNTNPVGDNCYVPPLTTGNTVLLVGGCANFGASGGRFCGRWLNAASNANWSFSAFPFLKSPVRGA